MIKNQSGYSIVGSVVAVAILLLLLLLSLNANNDSYMAEVINSERELDLEYSFNSLTKSLVNTSDIFEDKEITTPYYLDVIDLENPNRLHIGSIYTRGDLDTKGRRYDIIDSRLVKDLNIQLAISDEDKFYGKDKGKLNKATYSFKSIQNVKYDMIEGEHNLMHAYRRYFPESVVGVNISYSAQPPKDLKSENLKVKIPREIDGGAIREGSYESQ